MWALSLLTYQLPHFCLQAGLPARFGGFLPSSITEGFDLALFGLSGGEAELMDPQQRLLLEVSLEVSKSSACAAWCLLTFSSSEAPPISGSCTCTCINP